MKRSPKYQSQSRCLESITYYAFSSLAKHRLGTAGSSSLLSERLLISQTAPPTERPPTWPATPRHLQRNLSNRTQSIFVSTASHTPAVKPTNQMLSISNRAFAFCGWHFCRIFTDAITIKQLTGS